MPARKIDLTEFRRLHDQGLHRDELAAHFNAAPDVITRTRRVLGLPLDKPRWAGKSPIKVDAETLARLTADGWTLKQLAEHFNAHPTSISRLRSRLGISPKPAMTPDRKRRIEAMLADGWSFAEIGRTEGADPETLRRHFPGQAWTTNQRAAHLSTLRHNHDWNGKHHKEVA